MNARTIAMGIGAAITTFLLAGATKIELLGAGEAPGIGIIGVLVGVIAGLLAGGLVSLFVDRLSGIARSVPVAYATFGAAYVVIAGMSYVNVPGADDVFTFPVHVGVSLIAAVVVALVASQGGLSGRPTDT
jgi:hypothetical protein